MSLFGNIKLFAIEIIRIDQLPSPEEGTQSGVWAECRFWWRGKPLESEENMADLAIVKEELSRMLLLAPYRVLAGSEQMAKDALFENLQYFTQWEINDSFEVLRTQIDYEIPKDEVNSLIKKSPYECGIRFIQDLATRLRLACVATDMFDEILLSLGVFYIVNEYNSSTPCQRLLWQVSGTGNSSLAVHEECLPVGYFDSFAQKLIEFIDRVFLEYNENK